MPHFEELENAKLILDVFSRHKERFGPYAVFMANVMAPTESLGSIARETIALRVSAINECHYCVGSHRSALVELGCSHLDVRKAETGHHSDPKLQALLSFADKLTLFARGVAQADIAELRRSGASDQDIEDTIAIVSVFALMNRLVDGYGVRGDAAAFALVGKSVSQSGYDTVPGMLGFK